MIKNLGLESSLISEYLSELRDVKVQKDRLRFRRNLERLGNIFAYEISKELLFVDKKVMTPLAEVNCKCLKEQPVLATILRAGVPFFYAMLEFFDRADSAFISSHRVYSEDHSSFEVKLESLSCPSLDGRTLIISDPMLATGSSLIGALEEILNLYKPKAIHVAAVVASEEGVQALQNRFPEITIWVGAVDPTLNANSYIVPGMGDAGDLAFGTKMQN